MPYVEERDFNLHFALRCEFPENYDGEEDGYEWAKAFPGLANEMIRACVQIVSRHPGWKIHPGNRGLPSDREVTLVLERVVGDEEQPDPKPGPNLG